LLQRLRHIAIPFGLSVAAFALAITQRPGWSSSDTKIGLHVDPLKLLSEVADVWSSSGTTGHVQGGQYSGYLLPMGPFFALMRLVGVSSWLSERLWLGLVLAVGAWGMVRLLDVLYSNHRGWAHAGAGAFMLLNGFVVTFANRTSVTLMALAVLPWLIVAVHRGLRHPTGWREPTVVALLVTISGGGVNSAVTALMLIGPLLLCIYELGTRMISGRALLQFCVRALPLTLLLSLWWIAPVLVQASYGIDFLQFTEQPGTIWQTGSLSESLRVMGYWISYLGVGYGSPRRAYLTDASVLLFSAPVVVCGLLTAALPLLGLAWTRRAVYAPFFLFLVIIGLGVMSLGWPLGTPMRSAVTFTYNHFPTVQFLRSTYKAGPLVVVGLAGLAGLGIERTARLITERAGRAAPIGHVALALGCVALLSVAVWPLVRGKAIDQQVVWKQIPKAWTQTANELDASLPQNTRAMVLPGQLYSFYNWGGTVDPILPVLSDRPVVVRSSTPYADLRADDLIWTIDDLVQQQRVLPGQLSQLLALLGVGQVITATDDNRLLSGSTAPADAARALAVDGGLKPLGGAGPIKRFAPGQGRIAPTLLLPQVRRAAVASPRGIARLLPRSPELIVDGSAASLASLAALGEIPKNQAIFYAADRTPKQLQAAALAGAHIVVGDSNQRRVVVPSRLQQNLGPVISARQPFSEDAAVLDPFPDAGPDAQTVAEYSGLADVSAPYSPGFAQFPEHRPIAALDQDERTSWRADRFLDRSRWYMDLSFKRPTDVPVIDVLPDSGKDVTVNAVIVNGRRFDVANRWNHLVVGLRGIRTLRVGVDSDYTASAGGIDAGGIKELRIPGLRVDERLRLPLIASNALSGNDLSRSTLTYLLTRITGDDPYRRDAAGAGARGTQVRNRADGELAIRRRIVSPARRTYRLTGLGTFAAGTPDSQIDSIAGTRGAIVANSSGRFLGSPGWRASMAFDGSRSRPWIGTWVGSGKSWISWKTRADLTISKFRLAPATIIARRPTAISLVTDGVAGRARRVAPNGAVTLPEPVKGRDFRLKILAAGFPPGASGSERMRRAVAIGEIEVDRLGRLDVPTSGPVRRRCGVAAASADTTAVLAVSGSVKRLDSGLPLTLSGCNSTDSLTLVQGSNLVQTNPRLMNPEILQLNSPAPAGQPAVVGGGRVLSAGSSAGSGRSGVRLDPSGPSWLVLAQSWSRGWRASCNGTELGAPQPIDGFANGWPVSAGCRNVRFYFAPMGAVRVSYAISGFGIAAALILLAAFAFRRRRKGRSEPAPAALMKDSDPPAKLRIQTALLWGIAAACICGFIFGLRAGVALGPLTALLLWRGVSAKRLFIAAGLLLAIFVPTLYVVLPVRNGGGYNFDYSAELIAAHWVAVLAVTLLALGLIRCFAAARSAAAVSQNGQGPSDSGS
jgi:hypothetical protein